MKAGTRSLASLSLCVVATVLAATLTTQFTLAAAKSTATVVTDLSDYPPGTQVNVAGSGWLPSEVVQLTFTETATMPPGGFTDGPFVFYATADDLGNIANGEFYTDQHDIGVSFLLTAKGAISGRMAQTTFMDSLPGMFEIEGNTKLDARTSHDWDQVFADYMVRIGQAAGTGLTAGTGSVQFTTDGVANAQDDAFSNSPKDTQDITAWKWSRHSVSSPKTDLEHGFAAAYLDSGYGINSAYGDTHTLLFVGTDRYASGSNSAISMWFLQHPIGAKADGTFCKRTGPVCKPTDALETHTDGDLLIQADLGNLSNGGVGAYKWIGGTLQPITLSATQYKAVINTATISVPWSFIDTSSSNKPLAQEFFEVGLDLNEVFHAANDSLPDFSSFIITSRTSNSQTATLADFILGNISSVPDIAVDKVADAATVNVGGQVGFKVTVRNVGVGDVTGATLSDPLPAGAGNDLNWTLVAADSTTGVFQITGPVGNQVLSFISPQILPNNSAPLVAHVVATANSDDLGKLHNVATVTAVAETVDFQANNVASPPDVVVVPAAVNDSYSTPLNTTLNLAANGVLSNDGTPLTGITSVLDTGAAHGTVSLGTNGSFTYTPASNFSGTDTFTYRDKDAAGNFSNLATVTITVNAATLTVTKVVDTTAWGGNATAGDFSLSVGSTPVASGVSTPFAPGTYTVGESGGPSGYSRTSIICDGSGNSSVTLLAGDHKSCTITNTSLPAHLTLTVDVKNDNGGSLSSSDFGVSWTGPTNYYAADVKAGTYTLVANDKTGYTTGSWSCTGTTLSNGAVTLGPGQSATCKIAYDDVQAKLRVIKAVNNTHGGTKGPGDFTVHVKSGGNDVGGSPHIGEASPGTLFNLDAGTYSVSENDPISTGYQQASIICDGAATSSITLAVGDNKTCTITNNDKPAHLKLVKTVTNDNGGTAEAGAWTLSASGPTPLSGPGGAEGEVSAGTYTLAESGGPDGYTAGSFSCTNDVTVTAGKITLALNQSTVCTINNDDKPAHLKLVKTVTNNNGGKAAATAWTLSASGPTPLSGSGGAESDVNAGIYALSESGGPGGYTAGSFSCTNGVIVTAGQITLALSQSTVCTINNDDQPASLTVSTLVVGGPNSAADFSMSISGGNASPAPIPGSLSGVLVADLDAGAYVVNQGNAPIGYSLTSGCSKTLANGENASCTMTYTYAKANLSVSSAMSWVLHDSLKVEGFRTGAANAGSAKIVFRLYGPSVEKSCVDTNLIYEETLVGVAGDATYPTVAGFKVTDPGTYRWVVSYSGDDYNNIATTTCGDETHTIIVGEPTPPQP